MTVEEFSNQFDTLVHSYTRFRAFDDREPLDTIEFNEYEKSLFLTKAQEDVVLSLYNGRSILGESFEETEELRRYLSSLVKEASINPMSRTTGYIGVNSNSKFFTLPSDLWFITYEAVSVTGKDCDSGQLDIYPVRQDEYHKIKRNPFRGANDRRALRLDLNNNVVEIVCKYIVDKYYVRYMRKLQPIILVDLPDDVTIGHTDDFAGNTATECEVHEGLHQHILETAVLMALQSRGINPRASSGSKKTDSE